MASQLIKGAAKLEQYGWPTLDPFLFCVHHLDKYPVPKDPASVAPDPEQWRGRNVGSDFSGKDGFSLYHGQRTPGFPRHPHFGFETITAVRRGMVDHTDSKGAFARYGQGDAQWLTTGKGVCHSEMFPLLSREDNTMDLFQIWLNLPAKSKKAEPYFSMAWADDQPRQTYTDAKGRTTKVHVIGGELAGMRAPPPPPASWAADPSNKVAVATIEMQPGATWTLPKVTWAADEKPGDVNRMLYFFRGDAVRVGNVSAAMGSPREFRVPAGVQLAHDQDAVLENTSSEEVEVLVLQGRPIAESVVQRGPFVTNSQAQLREVMMAYQATEFGDWPFPDDEPVHPRTQGRFAKYPDGKLSQPTSPAKKDETKESC